MNFLLFSAINLVTMVKKHITFLILLCVAAVSSAKDLASAINAIINQPEQKKATFGVKVISAKDGSVVFSNNANLPLTPASNMKVLTSASALKYLGPEYVFSTKFYLNGKDLIVVGSGDPLLGDEINDKAYKRDPQWIFQAILCELNKRKITEINNIIVDSSIFDDQRVHSGWPANQLNRYYEAQVCGINYFGNCIDVKASARGESVCLETNPQTKYVKLINKAQTTTQAKNSIWCSRPSGSNSITVYGKCYKTGFPVKVTVDRPAAYFGFLLAERLLQSCIPISGKIIERHLADLSSATLIFEVNTPLADVMTRCNRDSFGLAAETLIKTISANFTAGKINGEWRHGQHLVAKYLESLNVSSDEYSLQDGSGLSDNNKVSANLICTILYDVYNSKNWIYYKNTLAVGGISGSSPVKNYFREPAYKGRIFAKSGTINGVKSLSGVCTLDSGDYIFSVIVNNASWQSRTAINDIVKAIIDCN